MKKFVSLVGVVALAAALAVPAAADNGITNITDGSTGYISTTSVKTFINSTLAALGVSNQYNGSTTVVATTNTGGNKMLAVSDVSNSSQTTDAAVTAVEGETEANVVLADTSTSSDQEEEESDEVNVVDAVSDDSTGNISTDDTEESVSTSETTEVVEQTGEQHDAAVIDANTGDNEVYANDIEGVTQVTGPSGAAVKFTKKLNFADFLKIFTYKQ